MKNRTLALALAGLLTTALSFPFSVSAEGPDEGMHGPRCPQGERPSPSHRLDGLHDALKLTSAQESAWKAYREVEVARFEKRASFRPEVPKDLSAPERLEKMLSGLRQQQDDLAAALSDTKKFYVQLTPEQQKIFDRESSPRHPPRGGEGRELPPPPPEER